MFHTVLPWSHTVLSCKFFIDLCSWDWKTTGLERKLYFVPVQPNTSIKVTAGTVSYFLGSQFCRVIPSGKQGKPLSESPWKLSAERKCDRKKNAMLLWLNSIQLVPFEWLFFLHNRWFQKGHVMVTRNDGMAMCGWAEVSFIAFWTTELVRDMHASYWLW